MIAKQMVEDNEILAPISDLRTARQTRITIETHTTTVIRTSGDPLDTAFCVSCGSQTADLSPANAAAILQLDQSALELFTNTGELHTTQRGGYCGKSLIEHSRREVGVLK
jgi:hypothetical protein